MAQDIQNSALYLYDDVFAKYVWHFKSVMAKFRNLLIHNERIEGHTGKDGGDMGSNETRMTWTEERTLLWEGAVPERYIIGGGVRNEVMESRKD